MAPAATDRRWRGFADVVALALGINVWISIVVLPAAFVGVLAGRTHTLVALLPLVALIGGLLRRSEVVLLGLFPAATLVPLAVSPQMASTHVYGPVRFAIVALGFVAYLLGVSYFTTFHEPPAPISTRPLTSAASGRPRRWLRRERVYWGLFGLSIAFPAVLLWFANFDGAIQWYLEQMYPGRVALMTTMIDVGVIALWLVLYLWVFLGVMRPHRTGDRELVVALAQTRASAATGRPRVRFYLGVAVALGLMAALVVSRHM
ncbi:MAG: hypothetical protein K8W52_22220 [Deltaproteobacteria bacterium]|nr:hypothetical protein [Deltaproteobacteria bacterium]